MVELFPRLHRAFWTLLLLTTGYALGTFNLAVESVSAPPVPIVLPEDIHEPVPLVHVREINAGEIVGTISKDARLVIGDTVVLTSADGSFHIPAKPFLLNIIDVPIPHGALFVASNRGKNYYPVDSSAGNALAPENRLYFQSAEDAEALGYKAAH